jgi:quaternary ammonium compound-resistance protein SugE
MAWLILLVAGVFEVAWAVGLKFTAGLTRLWPSVLTVAGGLTSFVLLA